ncbi:MAG: hypothetical protein H0Z35_11690 [Thermoanaerobacteraceae bacterium]|nr:hypothetical protein [Thermoanaerobacteraceae bacterium]
MSRIGRGTDHPSQTEGCSQHGWQDGGAQDDVDRTGGNVRPLAFRAATMGLPLPAGCL